MNVRSLVLAAAVGAGVAYMFDPDRGRRRRTMARDRAIGLMHRGQRRLRRLQRRTSATAYGVSRKLAHVRPEERENPDDITLVHVVESQVFRDPHVPKGRINIDAVDGVITLRGALDRPEQIRDLEAATRKVHGVRDVHNLLHLVGTPAPNKAEVLKHATATP
jgi:hypothetical protein